MSNKIKKKLKKEDKLKIPKGLEGLSEIRGLKQQIKRLEKELSKRDRLIEELTSRRNKGKTGKIKRNKPAKHTPTPLFKKQTKRVGVMQKQAWQRHGYLRDRYEFHLLEGREKSEARGLADRDLRDKYGEEAGYTMQELEDILS